MGSWSSDWKSCVTRWRLNILVLLWGVALLGAPNPIHASPPPAGKVTQVKGTATLHRVGLEEALSVHFRDDVFLQDKIRTKEQSMVRVLLGGKALVTVRELSVLTITEAEDHATIDIKSGTVGLSVARKRMKPGEYIEINTPHAIAAVRGTIARTIVTPTNTDIENLPDGLPKNDAQGNPLGIEVKAKGGNQESESIVAGQEVAVNHEGLGEIQQMTPQAIAQGLQSVHPEEFGGTNAEAPANVVNQHTQQATTLAQVLIGEEVNSPQEEQQEQGQQEGEETQEQGEDTEGQKTGGPQQQLLTEENSNSETETTEASQTNTPVIPTQGQGSDSNNVLAEGTDGDGSGSTGEEGGGSGGTGSEGGEGSDSSGLPFSRSGIVNEPASIFTGSIQDEILEGPGNLIEVDGEADITLGGAEFSIQGTSLAANQMGTTANPLTNLLLINGNFQIDEFAPATNTPLLSIDPTTVNTSGDFAHLGPGASLLLNSPLLTDLNSVYSIGGAFLGMESGSEASSTSNSGFTQFANSLVTAQNFLRADAANLAPTGSTLVAANSNLAFSGALADLTNGTVLEFGGSPVFQLSGGSLTARTLASSDGLANQFNFNGTMLDLSNNAIVTLEAISQEPNTSTDVATFNLTANQPVIRMNESTLTLTEIGASLVYFENPLGSPLNQNGVALIATGNLNVCCTLNIEGPALVLDGFVGTLNMIDTNPQLQLMQETINQTSGGSLVETLGTVTVAGQLLNASETSTLNIQSLLSIETGGSLTSTASGALFEINSSSTLDINTRGMRITDADLTLDASFLLATDSTIHYLNEGDFIEVLGDSTLTVNFSPGSPIDLISLNNSTFNFQQEGSLLTLNGNANGNPTVDLDGSVLFISSEFNGPPNRK